MPWYRRLVLVVAATVILLMFSLQSKGPYHHPISSWLVRLHNAWHPPRLILTWVSDSQTSGRQEEYDIALENRLDYCSRHEGYLANFQDWQQLGRTDRHIVWSKWPALKRMLWEYPRTEWVCWMDEDILITNPHFPLLNVTKNLQDLLRPGIKVHPEHLNDFVWSDQRFPASQQASEIDLIISTDGNAINAGIFMLRNTRWSRRLLDRLEDQWLVDQPWPLRENQALIYLIEHDQRILNKTGIVGQRVFNSYREGPVWMNWQPGDFAIHLVACHWNGNCKELYDKFYWGRPWQAHKADTSSGSTNRVEVEKYTGEG